MKAITAILLLFIGLKATGQNVAFVGISLSNIGHSLQAGANVENNVFTIAYSKPLISAENPTLFFATVGREFSLGNYFALTPSIGYSFNKTMAGIATVELSKEYYNGRFFIAANYCKVFFAGGGIKVLIR
jgi:hypothetical protein